MKELIYNELKVSSETISKIDPSKIEEIADVLVDVIRGGHQVLFMGNGGSSADAQHIAAELSGKYLMERPAMPGVCLSNIAPVTAIGNDYSYDKVFERQVQAFARKGDAVIGISTSGNSKNIVLALQAAREIGCITISWTGPGGIIKDMVDHALIIPSTATPRIQEGYFVAGHTICGLIERGMFGPKAVFIDRDGTIVEDVPHCSDPKDIHVFDGVPQAIAKLNNAGYLVIVITNQSVVGRGMITEDTLSKIHAKMIADIEAGGGKVDDIFYCPHHPDDECPCRKPKIGLGEQAISKYKISTKSSFMIGDTDADMRFGENIGCHTVRVKEGYTFVDAVNDIVG